MNFLFLLFIFIILFALLFKVAGISFDETDYTGLPEWATFIIYIYRNAIGDMSPPVMNLALEESSHLLAYAWITFLLKTMVMNIVMLNFLIAIIGGSYNTVMDNPDKSQYFTKCAMTQEDS